MKLNVTLWNEARLNVEAAIKVQKQVVRSKGSYASRRDWGTLRTLKRTATRLYAIRATARGGDHAGQQCEPEEFAEDQQLRMV